MKKCKVQLPVSLGLAFLLLLPSCILVSGPAGASGAGGRGSEGQDDDLSNNDDFSTAHTLSSGEFLDGTTGLGDTHRIDTYVLKDVPAGKVVNASLRITNFNNQALSLTGWNKYHTTALAWSNSEAQPVRRAWEAMSFLCVVSGDYYFQLKPIAGAGTIDYTLHAQFFDPLDITAKIGTGGAYGPPIPGQVSSEKWYPAQWYRFQLNGEQGGMNDNFYVNMTLPGAPNQRLLADLYVRNLEPETFSYWLNHSWWLDSFTNYEEAHAAACGEGSRWYYLEVEAYDSSGGRSESYELRLSKGLAFSDGDNSPKNATPVSYEPGKTVVTRNGSVARGPDMFDWYKVYLKGGEGVSAELYLTSKSTAVFRLSIYRDNLTSPYTPKGYDLMSSWTNKPADALLNRVTALTTNVTQEGWYYIGVMAIIGLVPTNISLQADWTVQSAWASYRLNLTLPDYTQAPRVANPPAPIMMDEDGLYSRLELNDTGPNSGVFSDADFGEVWGDRLSFNTTGDPNLQITIADDPEATVTLVPNKDWNGQAYLHFQATDLYGRTCSTVVEVSVRPVNDPPFARAGTLDFAVKEGSANATMNDIELSQYFGDPDFSPFGDDHLTFSVDNSTFPAWVNGSRLTFGAAPVFPGHEDQLIAVNLTATDRSGANASFLVRITVIDLNRRPQYNESNSIFQMDEDALGLFDLNRLFWDPDGDYLEFTYLGGASDNITVAIAPNGTAVLRPAKDYFIAQELLRFRADDPLGANRSGELVVTVLNVNDPPYLLPGGQTPDPLEQVQMNESDALTFRVTAADVDNRSVDLRYAWFVDGVEKTALGISAYPYRPGYDDAGTHTIRVRVSDGLASVETKWTVLVEDVNRLPVISELWPENNTEVAANSSLVFRAAALDPDGDALTFTWRLSNGTLLREDSGTALSTFTTTLPPGGNYTVILTVRDGRGGSASARIDIRVLPEDTGEPPVIEPPPGANVILESKYEIPLAYMVAIAVISVLASLGLTLLLRRKRN